MDLLPAICGLNLQYELAISKSKVD